MALTKNTVDASNTNLAYEVELKGEVLEDSDYRVDAPNADEYFANNSNLIDEYNIEQSITIQS